MNIFDLESKLILVTGASSGFGRETCRLLDSLGAKVIGIARNEAKLQELKASCKNFEYRIYDFYTQDGIKDVVDSIVKEYGKVNRLAYFAGVANVANLRSINLQEAKRVFSLNFFSALELIRNLCDKRKATNLSIVLCSSDSLNHSNSAMSIYDSSKGAIDALTKSIVIDLAKYNFRINSIRPGPIKTGIIDNISFSKQYHEWIEKVPLKNGGGG